MMQISAQRAREQELRRALWEIRDAIDAYKTAVEEGYVALSPDRSGYPPTLEILAKGVENLRDPKRGRIVFLRSIPRDPFFTDKNVPASETWGRRSYASSHEAPQEGEDVYDVYSLSGRTGLNDRPYRDW